MQNFCPQKKHQSILLKTFCVGEEKDNILYSRRRKREFSLPNPQTNIQLKRELSFKTQYFDNKYSILFFLNNFLKFFNFLLLLFLNKMFLNFLFFIFYFKKICH